jgi:hypothetical protein
MPSLLVGTLEGRVVSVGAKAMKPTVEEGNLLIVGFRLGNAWDSMPTDDCIGTMIASRPCGEISRTVFVATSHIGFETSPSPVKGVSEPEFLGCRPK